MAKSKILKIFGCLLTALLTISACSTETPIADNIEEPGESLPDMANPAAIYCEGLGYSMENVTRDGGQDADCIFPDGSSCAQWDFFAGRCGQEFSYCSKQGFTLEIETNIGICRFQDGSSCDEFQFFSGECKQGDNPGVVSEDPTQILDVSQARDLIAAYFDSQYGIQMSEPWTEQDITPADAVGSSTTRFVSGPMTIVISALAAAPSPAVYTIEEASFIANGFYWEGTLSFDGEIIESTVILPGTILSEEQARDAVMDYIVATYDLPAFGEWTDQGVSQTDADTVARIYVSGPWVVAVELIPAAPLVSSYHVTLENLSEGIRWEGDISYHGEINEISYSK